MHTIMYDKQNNAWAVMRSDFSEGTTFLSPLFNRLSFVTALNVCASLNGAGFLNPDTVKVLEMCKV